MANKKNKNTMVLVSFILTIIHMVLATFIGMVLAFNLFGAVEYIDYIYSQMFEGRVEIDSMFVSYYFELMVSICVNLYAAVLYFKGYKYRVNNSNYGRTLVFNGIIQLLFSTFIPGIFAIISGVLMMNKKRTIKESNSSSQDTYLNEYKITAMTEAITRLKELRNSGAISEDEYYEHLNKILEG